MSSNRKIHKNLTDKSFDAINIIFLTIFTIIVVYPFYNSVILSFNEGKDALKGGIYFIPRSFTLENYRSVLANPDFINAALITIARTAAGTIIAVLFTAGFGFVISKEYLAFRKFYIVFGLVTMYFNGGLIPTYILIRKLGLINNFLVYVLPVMFSMMNALIFMSFFRAIPDSMEESAKLDGANDVSIFVKIVLPVSTPVLASIGLFNAVAQWNSWYDTMLYTTDQRLDTLAHMFQEMLQAKAYLENEAKFVSGVNASTTTTSLHLASMVITVTPILLVYPFLQKYFAKGLMLGSIKG